MDSQQIGITVFKDLPISVKSGLSQPKTSGTHSLTSRAIPFEPTLTDIFPPEALRKVAVKGESFPPFLLLFGRVFIIFVNIVFFNTISSPSTTCV